METSSAAPLLRPFFSFFGSKWRLAPKYPPPRWDVIIEPFAGSAGYSLHYPERQVILIERDPQLADMWRWLLAADVEEIRALPLLKQGDSLRWLDVPEPARTLMGFWIHKGGAIPRHTVTARGVEFDWRERVARQLPRVRHWQVIEGDYTRAPDIAATWFIDPPYQGAGRLEYRYNAKRLDFRQLGEWCRSRSGQTIVCENAGANWLPFEPFNRTKGQTINGRVIYSEEVIWLNDRASSLPLAA